MSGHSSWQGWSNPECRGPSADERAVPEQFINLGAHLACPSLQQSLVAVPWAWVMVTYNEGILGASQPCS